MTTDAKTLNAGDLVSVKDTTGQFTPGVFLGHVVEVYEGPCIVVDTEKGRAIVKASDCGVLDGLDTDVATAVRDVLNKGNAEKAKASGLVAG